MTPGNAKSRDELPWLPYRTSDKVIINAHNFVPPPSAFSPAVNGKMPAEAWIPSRDDTGNGTTTLTDLVGSNNGTLTNMDPATDWVADTDAGGVRALDFDGSNDYIDFAPSVYMGGSSAYAASCWIYPRSTLGYQIAIGKDVSGSRDFILGWSAITAGKWFWANGSGGQFEFGTININTWYHIVITRASTVSNQLTAWINGLLATTSTDPKTYTASSRMQFGRREFSGFNQHANCRLDDIRFFHGQALDATDIADLYAAGLGRGIDAS